MTILGTCDYGPHPGCGDDPHEKSSECVLFKVRENAGYRDALRIILDTRAFAFRKDKHRTKFRLGYKKLCSISNYLERILKEAGVTD